MKSNIITENANNLIELNSKSYLEISAKCNQDISRDYEKLGSLQIELDDKKREIRLANQKLKAIKKQIKILKTEKSELSYEVDDTKRTIKANVGFLNKLNRLMYNQRGGKYLVDLKKRTIK